jgi:hypothetical protein
VGYCIELPRCIQHECSVSDKEKKITAPTAVLQKLGVKIRMLMPLQSPTAKPQGRPQDASALLSVYIYPAIS